MISGGFLKIHKRRKSTIKYKSGLEARIAKLLPNPELYESVTLPYVVTHKYKPDFPLKGNSCFIEAKGYWDAADRAKHMAIREQHPELRVAFIFARSDNKLNRKSTTTYAEWCDKYGFQYCDAKDFEADPETKLKELFPLK